MQFDNSKLRGRIIEKFGSQLAFSLAISMKPGSLSQRLKGGIDFTSSEIFKIIKELDIPIEEVGLYFFTC